MQIWLHKLAFGSEQTNGVHNVPVFCKLLAHGILHIFSTHLAQTFQQSAWRVILPFWESVLFQSFIILSFTTTSVIFARVHIIMSKKEFTVVKFLVDQGVAAVPSSWIFQSDEKSFCRFPDPIPKDFSKIQSDKQSKPQSSWNIYEVTCVKTSGKSFLMKI